MVQEKLFTDKVEFIAVPSVIGSGYESDVAKLAVESLDRNELSAIGGPD